MKKSVTVLVLAMCCVMSWAQSRDVRHFFCSEKGDVFSLLPQNTRLDMLDYYDSGQKKLMPNNMTSGPDDATGSRLIDVTGERLTVAMSSKSEITMQLLYVSKRDTMICVISTVKLPAIDSRIDFYNTKWQKLDAEKIFQAPQAEDFFVAGCTEQAKADALVALPFFVSSATITMNEAGKPQLVIEPQVKTLYGKEEWKRFEPLFKPSIRYVLSGKKFKKEK